MTQGLRQPADLGRDDRQATGQGLGDDHAERLRAGGQHQHVRGGVGAVEVGSGPRPREEHPVVEAAVQRAATETFYERRIAVEAAHADAVPGQVHRRRQRIEQHVVPLLRGHRRDAQQRPAGRCSGREIGGVDGRLGHMHSGGRQRVQLQQPAPGPLAGRDDGCRGREDRMLPCPGAVASVICGTVSQRHVHEHDQPQPARLRHEHLRGRRGDQPVEQHDGAVGDPLDDAREGSARHPVGSRPGAGYGVLVH